MWSWGANARAHSVGVTRSDDDYRRTMLAAELGWLEGIVGDLRSGALTWSAADLEPAARAALPGELDLRLPGTTSLSASVAGG